MCTLISSSLTPIMKGATFVFGESFKEHYIAFKVLPAIIFFSSFISSKPLLPVCSSKERKLVVSLVHTPPLILIEKKNLTSSSIQVMYYYGVIQMVVRVVAYLMMKTMNTSGKRILSCFLISKNKTIGQHISIELLKSHLNSRSRVINQCSKCLYWTNRGERKI